ncbi:MAG: hypothetical protein L0H63_04775 [Nitrococcus sp.]|nr:hypothetical protein [Nitrococcus sp.]
MREAVLGIAGDHLLGKECIAIDGLDGVQGAVLSNGVTATPFGEPR